MRHCVLGLCLVGLARCKETLVLSLLLLLLAVETTVTMAHANISGLIADSRIIKFVLVIYRRKSARVVLPYTGVASSISFSILSLNLARAARSRVMYDSQLVQVRERTVRTNERTNEGRNFNIPISPTLSLSLVVVAPALLSI